MSDPDFFLGYNITNFDFPYILNRAKFLNMKEYERDLGNEFIRKDIVRYVHTYA